MSKSITLDWDPVDQPAATDPVERFTWCSLCVRVGERIVSRLRDKQLEVERTRIYVPAFPIAQWLVQNWWPLLHELCPSERLPQTFGRGEHSDWVRRHCLRCADSSALLPALFLFHDGEHLRAEWYADRPGALPNMTGEFVAGGAESLEARAAEESFANFITGTLDRLRGALDGRVNALNDEWRAIQAADQSERSFCAFAGKLGIDPYDPGELTEEVAAFIEGIDEGDVLANDFLEVTKPNEIAAQWTWVSAAKQELDLDAISVDSGVPIPRQVTSPHEFGYELAQTVRTRAGVNPSWTLTNVENVANGLFPSRFRMQELGGSPHNAIRAMVGQSNDSIVVAGAMPSHPHGRRFLAARGLYHALTIARAGPRLVTSAHSWQQMASRAFAAELLAPREALAAQIPPSGADSGIVNILSDQFDVSTRVIENQLENAGIEWSGE